MMARNGLLLLQIAVAATSIGLYCDTLTGDEEISFIKF